MGLILTGYLPQLVPPPMRTISDDSNLSLVESACNPTVFMATTKLGLKRQLRPKSKTGSTNNPSREIAVRQVMYLSMSAWKLKLR